ncbi:MAG TPA: ribosome biogenesis protein [Euryarchaeota archaeon]|nr:ribosome biogenesis protein [Euryarchaeota archaeon]
MKITGKCSICGIYTMKEKCPTCDVAVKSPDPPRYSPQDRWSRYRRTLIKESQGDENHG